MDSGKLISILNTLEADSNQKTLVTYFVEAMKDLYKSLEEEIEMKKDLSGHTKRNALILKNIVPGGKRKRFALIVVHKTSSNINIELFPSVIGVDSHNLSFSPPNWEMPSSEKWEVEIKNPDKNVITELITEIAIELDKNKR
jgi:hypothetical protein